MYVAIVPNRNSPPAILLRESYRKDGKVLKRTVANISHLSPEKIAAIKLALSGKKLVPVGEAFSIERSLPHGNVKAVLGTLKNLGLDKTISSRRCRERDIIVALIVERLIHPGSKLATLRTLGSSTLADDLELADVDVHEIYAALAWLTKRQPFIEKNLAKAHLSEGGMALYDLSSSSYYGKTCTLAAFARGKKGRKKGIPCIAYGVMTDPDGRPVAISTYPGKTGDPATVLDQAVKLQNRFGLSRVILVADRGMLTNSQIKNLKDYPGIGWITAMKTFHLRGLVESGHLRMSLFDEKNLAESNGASKTEGVPSGSTEISSPDYPGERLIACFNPLLQGRRRVKRESLTEATSEELKKLEREVASRTGKFLMKDEIGLKAGRKINKYKMAKHFKLEIDDNYFSWSLRTESIEREAQLDGIYIVRTSEPVEDMSARDTVRNYKRLTQVERVFRSMKGLDLLVNPIFLSREDHVTAHIFLCMLAYYLEWHLREALAPVLFADEESSLTEEFRCVPCGSTELGVRRTRDPVKPAVASKSAKKKKMTKRGKDGTPLHSLSTLLTDLGTLCCNKCRVCDPGTGITVNRFTDATPFQERVFELLNM
jgi:transposase